MPIFGPCTGPAVHSLVAGAGSNKPDAMSKALLHQVMPYGTISAHVHGDGAYITERQGKDEAVVRFLTAKETRALDRHLRRLFRH